MVFISQVNWVHLRLLREHNTYNRKCFFDQVGREFMDLKQLIHVYTVSRYTYESLTFASLSESTQIY